VAHGALNPLARPLAPALQTTDRSRLAGAALPHLIAAWRDDAGRFPIDPRGVAAAEVALEAGADPETAEVAAFAGGAWLARGQGETRAALALIERSLATLRAGYAASPDFLRLGVECAGRLGEAELQDRLLGFPVRQPAVRDSAADWEEAALDLRRAERWVRAGDTVAAETLIQGAHTRFQAAGDARAAAIAAGQIADILERRGETDEALRIRCEEMLPVFERLGDVRERAVTMGRIADILQDRSKTDEALRFRREEELPVFERLGDVRERAVTMGRIADILQARGETDEALRIRREEQLPVFERLGDVRERAVTMGRIADILQDRGETDEALRIRREEELPVYERLGDVRSHVVTLAWISQT
jgi:tetratricopeptide (TPR) repeat protein